MRISEKSDHNNQSYYSSSTNSQAGVLNENFFDNILKKETKKAVYKKDINNFQKISIGLEEIEAKFLKNPNPQNYKIYAEFVRFHIQEARLSSRKVKKLKDRHSREYHIVLKINNLLEEMLDLIYYGKKELVRMLRMMSQIQGLLFDILV